MQIASKTTIRKTDILKEYLPFICFFIVFYILLLPVNLRNGSDDTAHFADLEQLGVLNWVMFRAEVWQPRYASDAFFAFFIFRLPLWKILNAAIMAFFLGLICKASQGVSSDRRNSTIIAVFVCLLFFIIHPNVITSSSVWYTGSFYYLWPIAAMFIGLLPFFEILKGNDLYTERKWGIPICIIFSLFAGYTEQTTAVQIGISLLILLYTIFASKKRPSRWLYIHFIAMIINGAFFVYSDFHSFRVLSGSENHLFPGFETLTSTGKLLLGINVFDTHLLRGSNIIFVALLALAGTLAFMNIRAKKNIFKVLRFSVFLPAAYVLFGAFSSLPTGPGFWNYTKSTMDQTGIGGVFGQTWIKPFDFLWEVPPLKASPETGYAVVAILALVCVVAVFPLLFFALKEKADRFLSLILYLAAICSGVVMGFSPTVWASESRPFFLANSLIMVIVALLIRTLCNSEKCNGKTKTIVSIIALATLLAFACYAIYLYRTSFITDYYWWY